MVNRNRKEMGRPKKQKPKSCLKRRQENALAQGGVVKKKPEGEGTRKQGPTRSRGIEG